MAEIIAQNPKKLNKLLGILIVVVVIIIFAGLGYYLWKNYGGVFTKGTQPEISFAGQDMPDGFLSGLPIESGAVLKDSFAVNYGEGNPVQRTISYHSQRSIETNFKNFLNYANNNGWKVINQNQTNTGLKTFYAVKDGGELNFAVNQEIAINKILVTITYSENQ
ncbi:MAG: hypothetical protein Q8N90_00575 [bacterium]|nr:hypothetical protein [bacterium]